VGRGGGDYSPAHADLRSEHKPLHTSACCGLLKRQCMPTEVPVNPDPRHLLLAAVIGVQRPAGLVLVGALHWQNAPSILASYEIAMQSMLHMHAILSCPWTLTRRPEMDQTVCGYLYIKSRSGESEHPEHDLLRRCLISVRLEARYVATRPEESPNHAAAVRP